MVMLETEYQQSELDKQKLVFFCCLSSCWTTQQFILSCVFFRYNTALDSFSSFGLTEISLWLWQRDCQWLYSWLVSLRLLAPDYLAFDHITCILSELFRLTKAEKGNLSICTIWKLLIDFWEDFHSLFPMDKSHFHFWLPFWFQRSLFDFEEALEVSGSYDLARQCA